VDKDTEINLGVAQKQVFFTQAQAFIAW